MCACRSAWSPSRSVRRPRPRSKCARRASTINPRVTTETRAIPWSSTSTRCTACRRSRRPTRRACASRSRLRWGSATSSTRRCQPGSVYDNPALALDERVAPYGVGLYRVHVTSGSCDQTIWVRLTGRSPLATVTGAVGSVAVVAGVALLGFGIARAIRRRRGIVLGALGGAVGGIGALLLSQQFGWIGITRARGDHVGGGARARRRGGDHDERHDLGRREHRCRCRRGRGCRRGATGTTAHRRHRRRRHRRRRHRRPSRPRRPAAGRARNRLRWRPSLRRRTAAGTRGAAADRERGRGRARRGRGGRSATRVVPAAWKRPTPSSPTTTSSSSSGCRRNRSRAC